jgi:hypothetical protein
VFLVFGFGFWFWFLVLVFGFSTGILGVAPVYSHLAWLATVLLV